MPAFVVMTDPRGGPIGSASNWTAGYMPAAYQGTLFRSGGTPLLDLATPEGVSERTQRHALDLLKEMNEAHMQSRPDESELAARIESYELAYRMQTSAAEAVDLDRESPQTRAMYGLDEKITSDFGRKCLVTRRLLERGVRFVQLYSGGGHIEDTWDGHNDCISNHKLHAGETDQAHRRSDCRLEAHRTCGMKRFLSGAGNSAELQPAKVSANRAVITIGTGSACGWQALA